MGVHYKAYDRVHETCNAPGTGTISLLGAVAGRQTFSVVGNTFLCYYCIEDQVGGNWEIGEGQYGSAGNQLSRNTVLDNSAGTAPTKINFSSGTQNVFLTIPAKSINQAVLASTHNRVYARKTSGAGVWEECNINELLDFITGTPAAGGLIKRGSSAYGFLDVGSARRSLRVNSSADDLEYQDDGAFPVTNGTGGTVNINEVGYVDATGNFKTTTTANLDGVAWCVVSKGNTTSPVWVTRRGIVTVILNANCSAGDYLSLSTTAGRAAVNTSFRAECFAVALTANAGGAGGTCTALLLTNTRFVPISDSNFAVNISAHDNTAFVATISGTPSSTSVVYNAPSSGNENVIKPADGTNNWGLLRLHNTTLGSRRLITDVNTTTNTITTVSSAGDSWANGNTITIESQTCTSGATAKMMDVDLSQATALSIIPATARAICFEVTNRDTTGTGQAVFVHPFESFASSKQTGCRNQVAASVTLLGHVTIKLINRLFCLLSQAGGTTSKTTGLAVTGYYLAEP